MRVIRKALPLVSAVEGGKGGRESTVVEEEGGGWQAGGLLLARGAIHLARF